MLPRPPPHLSHRLQIPAAMTHRQRPAPHQKYLEWGISSAISRLREIFLHSASIPSAVDASISSGLPVLSRVGHPATVPRRSDRRSGPEPIASDRDRDRQSTAGSHARAHLERPHRARRTVRHPGRLPPAREHPPADHAAPRPHPHGARAGRAFCAKSTPPAHPPPKSLPDRSQQRAAAGTRPQPPWPGRRAGWPCRSPTVSQHDL